jgi:hypothetical protein
MTLDECDAIFAEIRTSTDSTRLKALFGQLVGPDCGIIRIGLHRGSIFWRVRPCGPAGYANVRDVTYPPIDLAGLNRLSARNEPRFYGSQRIETALLELPECAPGQHFHALGTWVTYGHEIRVLVLGEQHYVYKLGYMRTFGVDPWNSTSRQLNSMPRERGLVSVYIDAFLGSILADPLARKTDYVRSRALLSVITQKYPADAVFYPSVKDSLGTNVVITPEAVESQMIFCSSRVVQVGCVREFGLVESTIRRQAGGIGPNGEFQWLENVAPDREIIFGLTKEERELGLRNASNPNGRLDLSAFQRGGRPY